MSVCTILGLVQKCHETAVSKGWWEKDANGNARSFGDQVALMHSELSEALEEFRAHGFNEPLYFAMGSGKPEGIVSEFADVLIRIFDTCGYYGWGPALEDALEKKMKYNEMRSYRHGGKKL